MKLFIMLLKTFKFFIFSSFFLVILAYGSSDRIYWNQRRYLTWEDFRVKHQLSKDEKYSAGTSCACKLVIIPEGRLIRLEINAVMYKAESWVKDNCRNENLLKHEQGHFDIVEINARKFRRAVKFRNFQSATYKSELDSLYQYYATEIHIEHNIYDKETGHSDSLDAQIAWQKKIELDLKESVEYANPEISFLLPDFK